jgi:hypothetical protein
MSGGVLSPSFLSGAQVFASSRCGARGEKMGGGVLGSYSCYSCYSWLKICSSLLVPYSHLVA